MAAVGGKVHFIQLDNSRMSTVKEFAKAFQSKFKRLDALVLNAGTGYVKRQDQTTEDGLDTYFQVNYLAHWLLVQLLLPLLKATRDARVVCLSSVEHRKANANWAKHSKTRTADSYPASKLAMALLAYELAGRHGLPAVAANPGFVKSDIWRYLRTSFHDRAWKGFLNLFALLPEKGCMTSVYGATADLPAGEAVYVSPYPAQHCVKWMDSLGPYNGPTVCAPAPLVLDKREQRTLWEFSAQLCEKWL